VLAIALACTVALVYFQIVRRVQAKRNCGLMKWAVENGLRSSTVVYESFGAQFPSFPCLNTGSERYADNLMTGSWRGYSATAFDYYYSIQGARMTSVFSAVIVGASMALKPLSVHPKNLLNNVEKFFDVDTITFESAEFNHRFVVHALDRKWAFDVLQPRAMEKLLSAPAFKMQFDERQAIVWHDTKFSPADFTQALNLVSDIFDLLPNYLVQQPQSEGVVT